MPVLKETLHANCPVLSHEVTNKVAKVLANEPQSVSVEPVELRIRITGCDLFEDNRIQVRGYEIQISGYSDGNYPHQREVLTVPV